jgi:hypothetical protein
MPALVDRSGGRSRAFPLFFQGFLPVAVKLVSGRPIRPNEPT